MKITAPNTFFRRYSSVRDLTGYLYDNVKKTLNIT